jgi:hypothetical protein
VRIRTTTSQSASPHPIPITPTPDTSVRSDQGRAPSSGVRVYNAPQAATARGLGADLTSETPDAARTIPLAALHHATTDREVRA